MLIIDLAATIAGHYWALLAQMPMLGTTDLRTVDALPQVVMLLEMMNLLILRIRGANSLLSPPYIILDDFILINILRMHLWILIAN